MAYQATGPAHGSHVDSNCLVAWLKKHSSLCHSVKNSEESQGGCITPRYPKEVPSPAVFCEDVKGNWGLWSCRISRSICQSVFWCYKMPCWHSDEFIDVYRIWLPLTQPMRLHVRNIDVGWFAKFELLRQRETSSAWTCWMRGSRWGNLKSDSTSFLTDHAPLNPIHPRYLNCISWKTSLMSTPSFFESGALWMLVDLYIIWNLPRLGVKPKWVSTRLFPKQCGNTWGSYGSGKSRGG